MISNVYKTDEGTTVLVIGLTHAELTNLVDKDSVLRLSPVEERDEGQPDVILFSAADEDALTFEMVHMFGTPGDDVDGPGPPEKENGK